MIRRRPLNQRQCEALADGWTRNRHTAMALARRGLVDGVKWDDIVEAHVFSRTTLGTKRLREMKAEAT